MLKSERKLSLPSKLQNDKVSVSKLLHLMCNNFEMTYARCDIVKGNYEVEWYIASIDQVIEFQVFNKYLRITGAFTGEDIERINNYLGEY